MIIGNLKKRFLDKIDHVRKKLSGEIEFEGVIYVPTDKPVIGGIAKALKSDEFSTEGVYYKIDNYIWKEGDDTSFIGDDGEPCGLHASFSGRYYDYYKPDEKKNSIQS